MTFALNSNARMQAHYAERIATIAMTGATIPPWMLAEFGRIGTLDPDAEYINLSA